MGAAFPRVVVGASLCPKLQHPLLETALPAWGIPQQSQQAIHPVLVALEVPLNARQGELLAVHLVLEESQCLLRAVHVPFAQDPQHQREQPRCRAAGRRLSPLICQERPQHKLSSNLRLY